MTDHQNIDELFRSQQDDWDKQPADSTWHALSNRLEEHRTTQNKSKRYWKPLSIAASILLILGFGIWFIASTPPQSPVAVNTNVSFNEQSKSKRYAIEEKEETPTSFRNKQVTPETEVNNNFSLTTTAGTINEVTIADAINNKSDISFDYNVNDLSAEVTEPLEENNTLELEEVVLYLEKDDVADNMSESKHVNIAATSNANGYFDNEKESKYKDGIDDTALYELSDPALANATIAYESRTYKSKPQKKSGIDYTNQAYFVPTKTINISFPTDDSNCNNKNILIKENFAQVLDCDNKIVKTQTENKTFAKLYKLTIEEFRNIEHQISEMKCANNKDVKIDVIVQLDTANQQVETIYWDSNCFAKNKQYIQSLEWFISNTFRSLK